MYNLDEDETALKVLAADMYDNHIRINSDDSRSFKLIKGKNGTTTFFHKIQK